MNLDPNTLKRQYLAHCLWMAEIDQAYAQSAATHYERIWPEVMTGLRARLDTDISRRKADASREVA
jgi:hypothetical protein